jgi:hypothetical protein
VVHRNLSWIVNLSAPKLDLARSLNRKDGPTAKHAFDSSTNGKVACKRLGQGRPASIEKLVLRSAFEVRTGQLPLTGDYTQNLDNECNGDLSPVETIGGGLDYFRLADED